jgi:hypothetical protein
MHLQFDTQELTCICFLDWLSERQLPGAGVSLKKKLMRLADISVVVGGTDETRAVVPRIGFKQCGEVTTFVRVVRPWRQFQSRPNKVITKDMAKLVRNAVWSFSTGGSASREWSINRVENFSQIQEMLSEGNCPTPARSADYLNYWLRTPACEMVGYMILRERVPFGYFLLSLVNRQARIADIRLRTMNVEDWANGYRLAAKVAADDERTCETVTIASTQLGHEALTLSGFKNRGSVPLYIADPKGKLNNLPPMFLNLIDGDAAYLADPSHPYVS